MAGLRASRRRPRKAQGRLLSMRAFFVPPKIYLILRSPAGRLPGRASRRTHRAHAAPQEGPRFRLHAGPALNRTAVGLTRASRAIAPSPVPWTLDSRLRVTAGATLAAPHTPPRSRPPGAPWSLPARRWDSED